MPLEPELRFVRVLEGMGRRRISLDQLREEFARTFPEFAEQPDRRSHLAGLIQRAADKGAIKLPRGAKAWDRSGSLSLPAFVVLTAPRVKRPTVASDYAWHPLLSFASTERNPRRIDALRHINEWLKTDPDLTLIVPIKERSLEIFGDEKRLDQLRTGTLSLFDTRLALSSLGCRICPIPLPYEAGSSQTLGRPILILENNDSWSSFCNWNQSMGKFSCVAYAGGGGAKGLAYDETFLDELLSRYGATELLYFGDIDPAGLRIAAGAARRRAMRGGTPLLPCIPLYRWLLAHGRRTSLLSREELALEDLAWLPIELRQAVQQIFAATQRIPQEALGTCVLFSMCSTFDASELGS